MPYTHAYVPQDHFDEVVDDGGWTFARLGDEYLAIWSWRPTRWQSYDPATTDTNGMTKPFELVADGGPNDVWITQLGSKGADRSFDDFQAAILANAPVVTPLGDPAVYSTGFDVAWTSPAQGDLTFGWDAPLTAKGADVPLTGYPRIDSPWANVPWNSTSYDIEAGGETLHLDVTKPERRSSTDA
jgi:hypothetical protein